MKPRTGSALSRVQAAEGLFTVALLASFTRVDSFCEPFAGEPAWCRGVITYNVYVTPSRNQSVLASAIAAKLDAAQRIPGPCFDSTVKFMCQSTFLRCDGSQESAEAINPCSQICKEYVELCEPILAAANITAPDCSATGQDMQPVFPDANTSVCHYDPDAKVITLPGCPKHFAMPEGGTNVLDCKVECPIPLYSEKEDLGYQIAQYILFIPMFVFIPVLVIPYLTSGFPASITIAYLIIEGFRYYLKIWHFMMPPDFWNTYVCHDQNTAASLERGDVLCVVTAVLFFWCQGAALVLILFLGLNIMLGLYQEANNRFGRFARFVFRHGRISTCVELGLALAWATVVIVICLATKRIGAVGGMCVLNIQLEADRDDTVSQVMANALLSVPSFLVMLIVLTMMLVTTIKLWREGRIKAMISQFRLYAFILWFSIIVGLNAIYGWILAGFRKEIAANAKEWFACVFTAYLKGQDEDETCGEHPPDDARQPYGAFLYVRLQTASFWICLFLFALNPNIYRFYKDFFSALLRGRCDLRNRASSAETTEEVVKSFHLGAGENREASSTDSSLSESDCECPADKDDETKDKKEAGDAVEEEHEEEGEGGETVEEDGMQSELHEEEKPHSKDDKGVPAGTEWV